MNRRTRQGCRFRWQPLQQLAPQGRLPQVFSPQRHRRPHHARRPGVQHVLPLCPALQPVAAVDLVLVEEVREALGQLQAAHGAGLLQETPQRRVCVPGTAGSCLPGRQQAGQHRHEAPSERMLVQRRTPRHGGRTEHGTIGPPQETGRQFHTHRRADALAGRQLHLQPLAHALALHEKTFFFEGRQGVVP